eukprot:COSAG05_NODE_1470_length_4792_cov_101.589815_6_plen_66_part_00
MVTVQCYDNDNDGCRQTLGASFRAIPVGVCVGKAAIPPAATLTIDTHIHEALFQESVLRVAGSNA